MSRLQETKCPFFKQDCLLNKCSLYNQRLENCAINLLFFNMFKLERAVDSIKPKDGPDKPGSFPFN